MKTAILAITLLMSGAAFAQTSEPGSMPDSSAMPAAMPAATAAAVVSQPGNQAPERDARNIAVISDPAMVPDGFNGVSGTATGGPLIDPKTNEPVAGMDNEYPACTAKVTDNCLQTYERGRKRA